MGTDELEHGPGMPGEPRPEGTEPTVEEVAREPADADATSRLASIQPRRFGKYNLIGKLGHGGMAKVLLAYVDGPGGVKKLVVVKRMHRHLQSSEEHVKMFLDEARLAARMNHPNVVQTYELGEIRGSHFMAMEYLEGQSFDRIWRLSSGGGRQLTFPLVARVFVDVLEGLHHAHELQDFDGRPLGVVHRDVSPQNVFVTYDGATKLLDFGVAKALGHGSNTGSGVLKGKCSYVAPEQAHGQPLDRRADLWSVGVMLWEALVGRRLFKAANDAATLIEVLTATIPLVREVRSEAPEDLSEVARKALQRNRDRRYPTAKAMRDDLAAYLAKQGDAGSREALGELLRESFGKNAEKHRFVVEACLAAAEHRDLHPEDPRIPRRVRGPAALPPAPPEEETFSAALAPAPAGHAVEAEAALELKRPRGVKDDTSDPPPPRPWAPTRLVVAAALVLVVGLGIAGAVALQPGGCARTWVGRDRAGAEVGAAGVVPDRGRVGRDAGSDASAPGDEPSEPADGSAGLPVLATAGSDGGSDVGEVEDGGGAVDDSGSGAPPSPAAPGPGSASPRPEPGRPPSKVHAGAPAGADAAGSGRDAGPAPAPRPAPPGYLSLDTVPWTSVRLEGRVLGETPLIRRPLPPGTHELTLVNTERGIRTTITVHIVAGETTTRRLAVR